MKANTATHFTKKSIKGWTHPRRHATSGYKMLDVCLSVRYTSVPMERSSHTTLIALSLRLPMILPMTLIVISQVLTLHFLAAQVPETASLLPKPNESPLFIERYAELQPNERISIQVYEQCNKSIVNIDTQKTHNILLLARIDEPGAGSGIILDKEGHILTNQHVIANVSTITVTLFNGDAYEARLVGTDLITDLAVLHIQAPPDVLFPITLADSSKLLGRVYTTLDSFFGKHYCTS